MAKSLAFNTITPILKEVLYKLMNFPELKPFRLVGGTNLSLRLGHRESVDIDLFTDAAYNSLDFGVFDRLLEDNFQYVSDTSRDLPVSFGKSYRIGSSKEDNVKLDLFYTDPFIRPEEIVDSIRMASVDDIVAMKVDVISRKGRKKDFWDFHELMDSYSIGQMLDLHEERYPYTHDRGDILRNLTNFESASEDFDPICFRDKYWEIIQMDIVNVLREFTGHETV